MTTFNRTPEGAYDEPRRKPAGPANIREGYEVKPAENGGWIVVQRWNGRGEIQVPLGAFSTAQDLLDWLAEAHEVRP